MLGDFFATNWLLYWKHGTCCKKSGDHERFNNFCFSNISLCSSPRQVSSTRPLGGSERKFCGIGQFHPPTASARLIPTTAAGKGCRFVPGALLESSAVRSGFQMAGGSARHAEAVGLSREPRPHWSAEPAVKAQSPVHTPAAPWLTHHRRQVLLLGWRCPHARLPAPALGWRPLIPKAAQAFCLCLFFPAPQLKPQQSIVKWTRYPAASNDVLQTAEPTDICSSALGKELFAERWVRAGDGNCCSCCSEIHLYLQVRTLCLEIHSASGKTLSTNWSFQLFRIHPLPGLEISSLTLNWL